MRPFVTTTFDQFGRYSRVKEIRRQAFGAVTIRILDVGDPYGTLAHALEGFDHTVSLDLFVDGAPVTDRHQPVIGSGLRLPFHDGAFDLVVTVDTLQHLAEGDRRPFIDELLRVSTGPVVIVAPFSHPAAERCERIVSDWVAGVGHSLAPLDEHRAFGLPAIELVTEAASQNGVGVAVFGDGWLYHWLGFMLLRGHYLSEGLPDAAQRIDAAVNTLLTKPDRQGPHYRGVVVLRPPPSLPDLPSHDVGDGDSDVTALTSLAFDLQEALPPGIEPIAPESPLSRWIESQRGDGGPARKLAESLAVAIGAARSAVSPTGASHRPDEAPSPSLAVVVVNLDGADHLRTCLDSLMEQDYPSDLVSVVVVDNGSEDGSLALLAESYPWVTVIPLGENVGFAPAVNAGVRASPAECIVLLNNDMRVDTDFLAKLARAYDAAAGVVCVGAQILSWDGSTIDFCEGSLSFSGHGSQVGFGRPVDSVTVRDGQDLLFACGGAMLVDRQVFLDTGGFDERFFAYFEDVDFGWRLRVLGYRTVLAADAKCYHRHHGTSARFPFHERILLYERNALRSILKNYNQENLHAALGPALLMLAERAALRGKLDRSEFDIGRNLPETTEVNRTVLAHLLAIVDLIDDLDEIMRARALIQRNRRVSDDEIIARFGRPLLSILGEPAYVDANARVAQAFGLRETFGRQRSTRMLIISNDEVGEKMSGPAIRAWALAKVLARSTEVTLAVPGPLAAEIPGLTVAVYDDVADLPRLAQTADVVLIQGYTLRRVPEVADVSGVLVVDLYDARLFESLEIHIEDTAADHHLRNDLSVLNEQLDKGDYFICASERQRDYWLGMLAARDRLGVGTYSRDPSLRDLIDVVPFGLPDRPPQHRQAVLKGVHPAIGVDDLVVLLGGGAWDWVDPMGAIEAWPLVLRAVPNAKLYFMGGLQLEGASYPTRVPERALQRAEQLGLAGRSVLFGDWSSYELHDSFLLEADLAVSVALDLAENRLAYRARILDYFWAGLPIVATSGDVLSDVVHTEQAGLVVPPGDPQKLAEAIIRLLTNPLMRAECAARSAAAADRFTWEAATEPLRRVCREPWKWRTGRELRSRKWPLTEDVQLVVAQREAEASLRAQEAAHWRDEAERARLEAEGARLEAEGARLEAEGARLEAEQARLETEAHRTEMDALRASAEHSARRLEQLRRTPGYSLFKAAKAAQRAIKRA